VALRNNQNDGKPVAAEKAVNETVKEELSDISETQSSRAMKRPMSAMKTHL
jgi:hypothetical protein